MDGWDAEASGAGGALEWVGSVGGASDVGQALLKAGLSLDWIRDYSQLLYVLEIHLSNLKNRLLASTS